PVPQREVTAPRTSAGVRAQAHVRTSAGVRAQAQARTSAGARASARVRTRQRLTARGRAAVASLAFVVAATGAVGVGAWAGQTGSASAVGAEIPVAAVTVGSGETLWGIAA